MFWKRTPKVLKSLQQPPDSFSQCSALGCRIHVQTQKAGAHRVSIKTWKGVKGEKLASEFNFEVLKWKESEFSGLVREARSRIVLFLFVVENDSGEAESCILLRGECSHRSIVFIFSVRLCQCHALILTFNLKWNFQLFTLNFRFLMIDIWRSCNWQDFPVLKTY